MLLADLSFIQSMAVGASAALLLLGIWFAFTS